MKRANTYSHFHKASICLSESCSLQQRPSVALFFLKVQPALKILMDQDEICTTKISLSAPDISLAGEACNVYGTDLPDLKLEVEYQTSERLHVKIKDSNNTVYQVGNHIFAKSSYAHFHSGSRQRLPTSRVRSMVLAQRLEASIRFPG
jgi:hypothetical protein